MPSQINQLTPSGGVDVQALVDTVDSTLKPLHAARLAELGQDGSGLFDHYRTLLESGSLFRSSDIERLNSILNRLDPFDHYVVYRAGLGEIAFCLALAGRRVTAWEANPARRAAIESGSKALAKEIRAAGGRLVIAGRDPVSIATNPAETSLGIAFDLLVPIRDGDEEATARGLFSVNALLYEPRLFLRARAPAEAAHEAQAVLAQAGFDDFGPGPMLDLTLATGGPVSMARWRAARLAAARPHSEREARGACKGVIAIVGSSYCGSTLLNALLGSHPSVAAGGELHWLTAGENRVGCAFCRDGCGLWTADRRDRVTRNNLYDLTAYAFDRPIVCDASKMTDWFGDMRARHPDLPRTTILLTKHPVRQAASYLQQAKLDDRKASFRDPEHVLRVLHSSYRRALADVGPGMVLRYEDLVADPKGTISEILAGHGLPWDDAVSDWQGQPHHHIGGNSGPRSQIARSMQPKGEVLRRKYARDGIFLDNSYLDTLDEETFAAVSRNPYAIEICEMFGYEPLDYPTGRSPTRAQ